MLSYGVLVVSVVITFVFSVTVSCGTCTGRGVSLERFSTCVNSFSRQGCSIVRRGMVRLRGRCRRARGMSMVSRVFICLALSGSTLGYRGIIRCDSDIVSSSRVGVGARSKCCGEVGRAVGGLCKGGAGLMVKRDRALGRMCSLFYMASVMSVMFVVMVVLFSSFLFLGRRGGGAFCVVGSSCENKGLSCQGGVIMALFFSVVTSIIRALKVAV